MPSSPPNPDSLATESRVARGAPEDRRFPGQPGHDPASMHEIVERTADGAVIFDATVIGHASEETFSAAGWKRVRPVDNQLKSGGRGYTLIIADGTREYVLRHFRRGGIAGRFVRDAYLWLGEDRTRSFAEWRLLHKLAKLGLRVPTPAVARYRRRGAFYTADIITVRIPGIRPLSLRLTEGAGGEAFWRSIGASICRFHDIGVNHADLSAHNVQIDDAGLMWLLDFDRARLMPAGTWRQKNLARLHRSLQKIRRFDQRVRYTERDWEELLAGYFQASRSA